MGFRIRTHRKLTALSISLVMLLSLSSTAALGSGRDVIKDCNDNGQIDHRYSQKEYEDALNIINADQDQYSTCGDLIRDAQLNSSKGKNGQLPNNGGPANRFPGTGGQSTPQSLTAKLPPAARRQVEKLQQSSTPPPAAEVAGQKVTPNLDGKKPKLGQLSDLPAPAVGLLGLLGFGFIGRGITFAVKVFSGLRR